MLAELAAANAAFGIVKQFIGNGKEIWECGEQLASYFDNKSELQKKANKNGYKSDLEAFMAAEQLKAQEEELKELMIYQGRAGMWTDWLNFQAEVVRKRKNEELARVRKKNEVKKMIIDGSIITATVIVLIVVVYFFFTAIIR